MVYKFHPVSAIINDSLRITKESAENADFTGCCHRQTDKQIRYLRAGIRCVILSQTRIRVFHIGDLEERIKSLLNLRRNVSDTAEPPSLLAEVGSCQEQQHHTFGTFNGSCFLLCEPTWFQRTKTQSELRTCCFTRNQSLS